MVSPRVSLQLMLLFLSTACTVQGTYRPPAANAAAAIVRGEHRPMTAFLDPLSQQADTRFTAIDGESTTNSGWDGYPDEVRVGPGRHTLDVVGTIFVNGSVIARGSSTVAGDFVAGRTYQVRTHLLGGRGVSFVLEPEPEPESKQ